MLYNLVLVSAVENKKNQLFVHIHSFLSLPVPQPMSSCYCQHSTELSSLWYTAAAHQLPVTVLHMAVHTWQSSSPGHPLLTFPYDHGSVLHFSVSIPALQIVSSVPFFLIPYICDESYSFFSEFSLYDRVRDHPQLYT